MKREKLFLIALVIVVGLLLSSSNALAVDCQADADCNGAVGLSDLVIMKQEFLESDCQRSTKCGRCNWPCYEAVSGECLFDFFLCIEACRSDPWLSRSPSCEYFCEDLDMNMYPDLYQFCMDKGY